MYRQGMYNALLISLSIKDFRCPSSCATLIPLVANKIPVERAQIEAVKIIDDSTFWVTSEDEGIGSPFMYKLGLEKNAPNKTN